MEMPADGMLLRVAMIGISARPEGSSGKMPHRIR